MREDTALQVLLELALHEGRQDAILLLADGQEAPVVLLDALIEDSLLGSAPTVNSEWPREGLSGRGWRHSG